MYFSLPHLIIVGMQLVSVDTAVASDSLRIVPKPAVIVSTPADTINSARVVTDRTVVSAAEIRAKAPFQLQEVINDVPGVFIRQYGGLGGLATVSIRGGNAAQSLVTLDGVRLNTIQSGTADVSTIPLSMIKTVDVQRGAGSASGGSNAMSGSVNLSLAVPKTGMMLHGSMGSFDSWKGAWVGALHTSTVAVGAALEAYGSAGNYAYDQRFNGQDVFINRQNGGVNSVNGIVRAEGPQSSSLTLIARKTSRGVPGAVVDDAITQTKAHYNETDVLGITGADVVASHNHRVHVDCSMRYIDQHYTDPQATITGIRGIDARYLAREMNGTVSWKTLQWQTWHVMQIHGGFADLRGTSLQPTVGDYAVRRQLGLSYRAEGSTEDLEWKAAARYDVYSDVANALVGDVGIAWIYNSWLSLRGNVGTAYRAPSFSEMYLLNYGNANLKPERSTMASVGVRGTMGSWLRGDIAVYVSMIRDLIVSVPLSPVVTSAMNVGRASSVGMECSATASIVDTTLSVTWKYTLQDVRDRTGRVGIDGSTIIYTPIELIHASANWSHHDMTARIEWAFTNYRYAQPGSEITSILAPYHVVNVMVGTKVYSKVAEMALQLRVDNLFNTRYSVIRGYPMPGIMVRVATEVQI